MYVVSYLHPTDACCLVFALLYVGFLGVVVCKITKPKINQSALLMNMVLIIVYLKHLNQRNSSYMNRFSDIGVGVLCFLFVFKVDTAFSF